MHAVVRCEVDWRASKALQDHQREATLCCVVLPPAYAQVEQKQAQVGLAAQAEFYEHVVYVRFDGLGGDHQYVSDLAIGLPACSKPGYLLLARGERGQGMLCVHPHRLLLQTALQDVVN